jgi:hypothetical protein
MRPGRRLVRPPLERTRDPGSQAREGTGRNLGQGAGPSGHAGRRLAWPRAPPHGAGAAEPQGDAEPHGLLRQEEAVEGRPRRRPAAEGGGPPEDVLPAHLLRGGPVTRPRGRDGRPVPVPVPCGGVPGRGVGLGGAENEGNCSDAPPLRAISEEESPDDGRLKLKSRQWMPHVEGKSFRGGYFD